MTEKLHQTCTPLPNVALYVISLSFMWIKLIDLNCVLLYWIVFKKLLVLHYLSEPIYSDSSYLEI